MTEPANSLPVQERQKNHESESETETAPNIRSPVEKRRARSALFNAWLLRTAEKNLNKRIKRDEKTAADEELSIRALLAQNETTPIITDPREYQIELFERAKSQNTIAVLDTGSGKTLIAVLLLRHVIDQELEDRREGRPNRIAFFLVCLHESSSLFVLIRISPPGPFCDSRLPAICSLGKKPRP